MKSDHGRFLAVDELADFLRPVVEIVTHEAGRAVGAVDDPDARVLREDGGQPFGKSAAQEIADDQHDAGVRTLHHDRRLRVHVLAHDPGFLLFRLGSGDFRSRPDDFRAWLDAILLPLREYALQQPGAFSVLLCLLGAHSGRRAEGNARSKNGQRQKQGSGIGMRTPNGPSSTPNSIS